MPAPKHLLKLIENFGRNIENYRSGKYNETQVRREFVETMLELHKILLEVNTDHEKTAVQRQIEATDGQIDGLVYKLYGLSEEEIGIVEESAGG